MIPRVWIALAIGAAVLLGGFSAVSALGAMNGTCDQTQDKLQDQLMDGSCDECPDCPTDETVAVVDVPVDDTATEVSVSEDGTCQEDDVVEDDEACDSCEDYLHLYLLLYSFLYNQTDLEPPHQSACGPE